MRAWVAPALAGAVVVAGLGGVALASAPDDEQSRDHPVHEGFTPPGLTKDKSDGDEGDRADDPGPPILVRRGGPPFEVPPGHARAHGKGHHKDHGPGRGRGHVESQD